jgi:DNA-directed RNA polymerase subunit beta'
MLQEAVDSLFDNTRRVSAVKTEGNRPLKSLSDMLKGKQGRFRQNLLGKRVDYSGRSVIVVGPNLKLHECGIPKNMAAELFKPFIIRKLLERGIVKTVKSAKKLVDRKEAIIWDILENILKGHPVLLNRAPTLHRLGIQAFQPKLVEGKAIQLHPLVCTGFNADFDGDQMAVHVPLGNAAVLEAQILMLASHNILNPANGAPITVPSQDMVLGLYYITKGRKHTEETPIKGEGLRFYSSEEAIIAYNEGRVNLHAWVKCKVTVKENGELVEKVIETTMGRILFNQVVPVQHGYINELLTKKSLRDIIGNMYKVVGQDLCARFLDDIKDLGFRFAFKGGLSFNLSNVNIPDEKEKFIKQAQAEVDEIWDNYNNGFITNNERYNQVIDIWTRINSRLADTLLKQLKEDQQGFNPVYMMLDSGARGSKEQIRQLGGMRGLMAKPQKNLSGGTGEIIENPILSNFKEGLSVIEYFISTHGARKGLADTALKTADAGYLTRRLHDVAQDVVVNEDDCGTLRGIPISALKDNEEVVETLYERILGRTSVHDIYEPLSGDLICRSGEEINEEVASKIEESPIEIVEIRSVLTCESRYGVCTKCYGRSMSTGRKSNIGDSVGVIAAQSIGEPGTQLTLRTFHVGGTASNIATESQMVAKFAGILEFEEIRTTELESSNGNETVVVGRQGEIRILDSKTRTPIVTINIPYGAHLKVKDGKKVEKGDPICTWDPYNAVIISEFNGKLAFENIIENVNYKEESDEQTGHKEKVIVESRDKTKIPSIIIKAENKDLGSKEYNLPVGAHIIVEAGHKIKAGEIIAKIPRVVGKTRDITGGLPRVTELFEARNPSNPAIVTEIDGVVTFGGIKRGNREIMITSKDGEQKKYLVPLSKHILVQENDFVKAGSPLSDGSISPQDILRIEGPLAVQRYILNGIMEVYRLQGVKINDKHVETIIRQMMKHIEIVDPGDTTFLEGEFVSRWDLKQANDWIFDKKVVIEAGDSNNVKPGQIISIRKLRDENSQLKRKDMRLIEVRDAQSATVTQIIMGITKASLGTHSFMSAASFQETTKVLNEAAISGKVDRMLGLKENVIVGHLIPAGTGHRDYEKLIVGSKEEFEALMASKED